MIPTEYTNNRYYYKNNIIIFNVYSKKIYNIYYYNTRFNNLYIYIYIYIWHSVTVPYLKTQTPGLPSWKAVWNV